MSDLDLFFDEPPKPPREGWKPACRVSDHEWELSIEEGEVTLHCKNPHTDEEAEQMDPDQGIPVCKESYWDRMDIFMPKRVPVKVRHVDDSTPDTPNGPAEYGFYLELEL